jgi:hypothetical protein
MLSIIIFIITQGWHNRPRVAAVPIVEVSVAAIQTEAQE